MRRIFYPQPLTDKIKLSGADAHHLVHVMRARPGDMIDIAFAGGEVARMGIVNVDDSVELELCERLPGNAESGLTIILAQALVKGEKMDLIVQKAVELGVTEFVPLATDNVVVRYDEKKAAARQNRWQKIAGEAAKQCGRDKIPKVAKISEMAELFRVYDIGAEDTAVIFCYEGERRETLKEVFADIEGCVRRVILIIGAEGGFTPVEAEAISAAGGRSVSLGRRILRAETAAIAVISIVQYELGDISNF